VSWRVIQLTVNIAAVVIVTSYSASVLSYIITNRDKLPFNTFEELLEVGTYTLAIGRHSAFLSFFEVSFASSNPQNLHNRIFILSQFISSFFILFQFISFVISTSSSQLALPWQFVK
jgi:hypothetical protein